ncbi:unnamed protein product, partial [Didymodactylos carnosus]
LYLNRSIEIEQKNAVSGQLLTTSRKNSSIKTFIQEKLHTDLDTIRYDFNKKLNELNRISLLRYAPDDHTELKNSLLLRFDQFQIYWVQLSKQFNKKLYTDYQQCYLCLNREFQEEKNTIYRRQNLIMKQLEADIGRIESFYTISQDTHEVERKRLRKSFDREYRQKIMSYYLKVEEWIKYSLSSKSFRILVQDETYRRHQAEMKQEIHKIIQKEVLIEKYARQTKQIEVNIEKIKDKLKEVGRKQINIYYDPTRKLSLPLYTVMTNKQYLRQFILKHASNIQLLSLQLKTSVQPSISMNFQQMLLHHRLAEQKYWRDYEQNLGKKLKNSILLQFEKIACLNRLSTKVKKILNIIRVCSFYESSQLNTKLINIGKRYECKFDSNDYRIMDDIDSTEKHLNLFNSRVGAVNFDYYILRDKNTKLKYEGKQLRKLLLQCSLFYHTEIYENEINFILKQKQEKEIIVNKYITFKTERIRTCNDL